jgi:recombination helicase AddA, Firmicutes type
MKWTKEQQEAIELRDKNILVSAAAGSGKTAVLVERIKQLILKDQIPLHQMLVVTFSNAAASEMREKIVDAISKEMEAMGESNSCSSKASFLREQLNQIHRANISTFHAFSMEVIRRYFYLIDIEPNVKICDEAQKTILQAEAMEQLFTDLFESGNQDFLAFLNQYSVTKNENAVKEMIYEAHNFIQSIPDSFLWLREKIEELNGSMEEFVAGAAYHEIRNEVDRSLTFARSCFLKAREVLEIQGISSLVPKCDLEIDMVEGLLESFGQLSFSEFAAMAQDIKFQTYMASKEEKEIYAEIKDIVSQYRDKGKAIIKKVCTQYLNISLEEYLADINQTYPEALTLCFLVESFDSLYKEKKKRKRLIDFNDIEHYALMILSHEEAAAEYRNKFQYIFIDEYQDSNIVQETLISRIKRDNNLFMVGDVKQSIYKFRLAEPEIFIGKYEDFKMNNRESDHKLDLNKNFRSKKSIIDAVNDIFRQIMNKDLSGLEYDDAAALYEGAPYEGDLNYPVELHIADDMQIEDLVVDDEIKEMKKAEIEAYTAVQIIKAAKGSEIFDSKRGMIYKLSNKDIVILLRSAKGYAEVYYEALMKEGIPAFVDTSDGYFDTMEIEVFLNLLKIIDNKKQDIPLLSVLRSPIFGCSVEELIRIRMENQDGAFYKAFLEYARNGGNAPLREKCEHIICQISSWKKEESMMTLEDFLWKLIRETGYYEYIGAIPAGVQRQANLRALIDKAVQFQSSQMKGLFSFIQYIEAMKKRKVAMGQVKLIGENDDVVRIMTIHKSKGLEFPMVIVGGLNKRFNRDSESHRLSLHKDIGLGLRYVDKEHSLYKKTLIQTAIEQKKSRESMAEELRILYVAFTRAMDRLVLLGTLTDIEESLKAYSFKDSEDFTGARSYFDFLIPSVKKSDIICCWHNRGDISIKKEETEQQKNVIFELIRGKRQSINKMLRSEIDRRLGFRYPYQEALELKSKFTVTDLNRLAKGQSPNQKMIGPLPVPEFNREGSQFTAAEKGTILHKIMEHLDFRSMSESTGQNRGQSEEMELIQKCTGEMVRRELMTQEELDAVDLSKVQKFFDSPIGRRACKAEKLFKEVSFNLKKEVFGEPVIVQGTIDCYFEENGRTILLDYKSNAMRDGDREGEIERITDNYRLQLDLYKEALEVIRKVKVEESYLYLFHLDEAIKIQ